jgi:hypothetical protein
VIAPLGTLCVVDTKRREPSISLRRVVAGDDDVVMENPTPPAFRVTLAASR